MPATEALPFWAVDEGDNSLPSPIDLMSAYQAPNIPKSELERAARDFETTQKAGFKPDNPLGYESPSTYFSKILSVSPQTVANAMDTLKGGAAALGAILSGEGKDAAKMFVEQAGGADRIPTKAEQIAAGLQNVGADVAASFTDPVQLSAMAAGAEIPAIGQKLMSAGFAADMLRHVPEQARAAGEASVTGTPFDKAKAYGGLGITALMAPALAAHAGSLLESTDLAPQGGIDLPTQPSNERIPNAAVQVPGPREILQRQPQENGGTGGGRGRMESGQQGEVPSGQINVTQDVAPKGVAQEIKAISDMPGNDFINQIKVKTGGLTGDAYRLGKNVTSLEEVNALKDAAETAKIEGRALMKEGKLDEAMPAIMKGQYFREAYEAATGTASAAEHFKNDPNYKAPFPEGKIETSSETPVQKLSKEISDSNSKVESLFADERKARRDLESGDQTSDVMSKKREAVREIHDKLNAAINLAAEKTQAWDKAWQAERGVKASSGSKPFFDRASEISGLGRPSTAPTVEDVRQQRTQDKTSESDPMVQSIPLDLATGSPIELSTKPQNKFQSTTEGDANITGLAERVRSERESAGMTAPTQPGKGIAPEASVERGRQLLPNSDPEKIMSGFEATKQFSSDDVAIVRAKTEQLARTTNQAESKFGHDSPEFKSAFKTESDWSARTKAMQTEWAKSGHAQQGEVDIDTGTFTGLARAYKEATGKDFTSEQADIAKKKSESVNKADVEAKNAQQKLYEHLDKESANPNANKESVDIWKKAKEYISSGMDDFNDIRNKLATDLGMSVEDVTAEMAKTKRAKYLEDDVWKKQQAARNIKNQAKQWLKNTAIPGYLRVIQSVPKILFSLKVGFHGTVALGTHAPMVAYQPPFWKTYIRDFGKMYKMVGSRAYYEMQVQDLVRRPNYITARRAGLVNDPFTYEDFNSPDTTKYLAGLTGMGNRGYSVLKILRQDMFDQQWSNLPKTAQVPEVAQAIADGLNHATGVVKGKAPTGANLVLFAPRLEGSRVAWLAVDPVKAAMSFADWKNATEGEKHFAINQVKEKAWVAGTLFSLLALNQGFLAATGSDQKINLTDPMKSDFLKFKVAGMEFSYGNAMLSMARLPVRLYQIRESNGGKLKNLIYPDENSYSVLGEYGRSQLSPFASLASSLWFKSDWQNRPLPSSDRSVPKRLASKGTKPYTWPEFWAEQVLPIPFEEAVREVWGKGLGMDSTHIKLLSKSMATIAVMGATGGRLVEDRSVSQIEDVPFWAK